MLIICLIGVRHCATGLFYMDHLMQFLQQLIIIGLQRVPLYNFRNRKAEGLAQAHRVKGRARTQVLTGHGVPRYPTAQQTTTSKLNVITLKPFAKMLYNM